jgi:hypothetical protein
MRRITKLDGDDMDQGVQSANQTAVSRLIDGEPISLGDAARSVVMRIKGGLPRISVSQFNGGEDIEPGDL